MKKYLLFLVFVLLLFAAGAQDAVTYTYTLKNSDKTKFDKAVADYARGRYKQSAEALRALSAKYPQDPDIFFYLGLNAVKKDFNVTGIRRYFTKVIELNAAYPDAVAHFYMGVIHYTDDLFEEAVNDFNHYFERANNGGTAASDELYMEASNYLYWSQFLAEASRNVAPFDPKVVSGLSSSEDEVMPYITWDGKNAYFLRYVVKNDRATFYTRELAERELKLFVSHRRDTAFAPGKMLPAPFNQGDPEGGVTVTADNNTLFYSVIRKARGYNNSDIYVTTMSENGWQPIRNLGDSVNGMDTWESQPSVTPDGQWLYFASNRKGGMGGTDIWRCHRKADGSWGQPQNLGSAVNTAGNEKCPFIHADGHTLYFASNGWQGFGGYDMYFVNLDESGEPRPINMGLPINTEEDDICFGVTADGQQAYYAGKSPQDGVGGTDVMLFDLYPAARPEAMRFYRGVVSSSDGKPLEAAIQVSHDSQEPAFYLTDSEGNFVIMVSSKNTSVLTVKAQGYRDAVLSIPAASHKTAPPPSVITLYR